MSTMTDKAWEMVEAAHEEMVERTAAANDARFEYERALNDWEAASQS